MKRRHRKMLPLHFLWKLRAVNAKFGREIALLSLPILIVGGVAFWNGKIKSWSGFGAPRGLFEGEPRLEITDWEKVEPSALDFARGISSRWRVTTWGGGVCPSDRKPPRFGGMRMPETLYFAWKRRDKWHQTPIRYGSSELDVVNFSTREKPISSEVHLGLPMDLVPKDAQEVHLRGHLNGWMMCRPSSITFPSSPINLVLKAPGQPWPQFTGARVSALSFTSANQQWCIPDPIEDPNGDKLQVESVFRTVGSKAFGFETMHSRVTDGNGRTILEITPTQTRSDSTGLKSVQWVLDTRRLKNHQEPFVLRSWVHMKPQQWPLQVALPLDLARPAGTSTRGISTYNFKPIQPLR